MKKEPSWELTDEESKELQEHFKNKPIKNQIQCPNCYGSGQITNLFGIWNMIWLPKRITCPKCNGSGKI